MQLLKKEAQVIMLPTLDSKLMIGSKGTLALFSKARQSTTNVKAQHFYFIIDERPKIGEWCYYEHSCEIFKYDLDEPAGKEYKKVIATTNTDLQRPYMEFAVEALNGASTRLFPQPSGSFIQQYVSEYNKGNVITSVMVEYEDNTESLQESIDNLKDNCLEDSENEEESIYYDLLQKAIVDLNNYKPTLKVDKNNCITITRCKDSWNREEVINLLNKFEKDLYGGIYVTDAQNKPLKPKWIEQNL